MIKETYFQSSDVLKDIVRIEQALLIDDSGNIYSADESDNELDIHSKVPKLD